MCTVMCYNLHLYCISEKKILFNYNLNLVLQSWMQIQFDLKYIFKTKHCRYISIVRFFMNRHKDKTQRLLVSYRKAHLCELMDSSYQHLHNMHPRPQLGLGFL